MKKLAFLFSVVSLTFLVACGGGGPANPGPGPSGFTNASFSGNFVFSMSGECVNACTPITGVPTIEMVGLMVADGKGNITGGTRDLSFAGAYNGQASLTGTYSVNSDGTADLALNDGTVTTNYAMILTGTGGGYILSSGNSWAISGSVEQQSTASIATAPTAKYVFHAHGVNSGSSAWGIAGAMDFTSLVVTADTNRSGTIGSMQTGALALAPGDYDATKGRGLLTINPSGGDPLPSMGFVYYVVDANTLEIMSSDVSFGLNGRAELSSGAVASGSVLAGSFAFIASGYPPTGTIQVTEGGIFTGDGHGAITSGTIDSIYDDSVNSEFGAAMTATGTVTTSNGVTRDDLVIANNAATSISMTNASVWFANSGRGFFLTTSADRAETGIINVQSGAPFTDAATYAFGVTGWAFVPVGVSGTNPEGIASATLFKNSGGTVSAYTQIQNLFGIATKGTGTGTLTFDSTGTLGSLNLDNTPQGGTENLRIYQYSTSNGFIMQINAGIVSSGQMTVQTAQ